MTHTTSDKDDLVERVADGMETIIMSIINSESRDSAVPVRISDMDLSIDDLTKAAYELGKTHLTLQQSEIKSGVPTPYEDLLRRILTEGVDRTDRTGTGTRSIFGAQMEFDLADGFPLVTTKKVFLRGVIEELLWLLKGDSNITYLRERNVNIWEAWADEKGNIGRLYPTQWRRWMDKDRRLHDQIGNAIELIKTDPDSRRIIVSAWNPGELDDMALAPCHAFFQFYVQDGKLSCKLTQRSADFFLGVPFNVASYSLLTMMIAQQTGLEPGKLIWSGGDCHIYRNHFEQVEEQLSREARPLPQMIITKAADIDSYTINSFELVGYDPHPAIKGDVAV